jgi:hypothetical protein
VALLLVDTKPSQEPAAMQARVTHLQVRIIALENLIIALLAQCSESQLAATHKSVCQMATFISPRAGFTQHPLTVHAAAQMRSMVDRAEMFQDLKHLHE